MKIAFNCPNCGKGFSVGIDLGGRTSKCGCGHKFQIPDAPTTPPPNVENNNGLSTSTNAVGHPLDTAGTLGGFPATDNANATWQSQALQTVTPTYAPTPSLDSKTASRKKLTIACTLILLLAAAVTTMFLLTGDESENLSDNAIAGSDAIPEELLTGANPDAQPRLNLDSSAGTAPATTKPIEQTELQAPPMETALNSNQSESPSAADTGESAKPIANNSPTQPDLSTQEASGNYVFGTMALLRERKYEEVLPRAQILIEAEFVVGYELQAMAFDGLAENSQGAEQLEYAKQAVNAYTELMEEDSEATYFTHQRGVNYGRLGEWDKAIDDLGVAVNHPDMSDKQQIMAILEMRAYAFEQLGDSEQATRHRKVIEDMNSGKLDDHSSLFLNQDRRYVCEFQNADFVFSLKDDMTYLFFPLGLTLDLKVDERGNVIGSIDEGKFEVSGNKIKLFASSDQVIEGEFVGNNLKLITANYDFGQHLVGRTFEYMTPEEFVDHSKAHKGGNGQHIKEPHEMFHRFILALDGGNMDLIQEFTYLGLGPKETAATLKAAGNNPKIRRAWLPSGKVEPERALHMLKRLDKARETLKESGFDVDSLKFFVLKVPVEDDLVANIGDKNGLIFTVYFDDVFMTPMGMKLFDAPTLLRKR